MTVRCRSARALLIAAFVRVGRNGWPVSAGGVDDGAEPGTIGVMAGGGGGTGTGRLAGPASPFLLGRSPFREGRSPPFREARSPLREARSPLRAARSPLRAARSPF